MSKDQKIKISRWTEKVNGKHIICASCSNIFIAPSNCSKYEKCPYCNQVIELK